MATYKSLKLYLKAWKDPLKLLGTYFAEHEPLKHTEWGGHFKFEWYLVVKYCIVHRLNCERIFLLHVIDIMRYYYMMLMQCSMWFPNESKKVPLEITVHWCTDGERIWNRKYSNSIINVSMTKFILLFHFGNDSILSNSIDTSKWQMTNSFMNRPDVNGLLLSICAYIHIHIFILFWSELNLSRPNSLQYAPHEPVAGGLNSTLTSDDMSRQTNVYIDKKKR